jgi:type II secretory pathway predicted ATPase ExeA
MIRTPFIESSHPEFQAEQAEAQESLKTQLREVAGNLESYRRTLRPVPSENAWVREWPALGSQKTWSKILRTDMDGINIAAKLTDYRGVLAAVQAQSRKRAAEELYDDLGGAQEVTLATLRLMHHHGKDRMILIEGGSGSGKTSSLDLLSVSAASGSSIYRMDANEAWKSQRVAMRSMLRALGLSEAKIPSVTGEMMETLISTIKGKGRIVIAIDEAHHVSGTVLNLFKSLLNETEMLLILAGMSTLFEKLRTAASEEAKQLIHNRLFQRVKLGGPNKDGAREFLSRRLGMESAWKENTLNHLVETARHCGHWSYLRRVVDQLHTNGITEPTDAEMLHAGQAAAREIA